MANMERQVFKENQGLIVTDFYICPKVHLSTCMQFHCHIISSGLRVVQCVKLACTACNGEDSVVLTRPLKRRTGYYIQLSPILII